MIRLSLYSLFVSAVCAFRSQHHGFRPTLSRHEPPWKAQLLAIANHDAPKVEQRGPLMILAPSLLSIMLLSSPVLAAASFDSQTFTNDYADPFHPLCRRRIEVANDGKTFHYSGTAVGPKDDPVLRGCSRAEVEEFGLRKGAFDGDILDGNRISAGDGIHEGVWEPANSASGTLEYQGVDGIRWNDGNKWIVQSQSTVKKTDGKYVVAEKDLTVRVGEFIFLAYIGASTLAGMKAVVDYYRKKRE